MPAFPAAGPVEVRIDLGAGAVDVIASDRTDVVATVVPAHAGRSGDESLAREASIAFADGRLRIRAPRRLSVFGQSDTIDVRVEVPTGSRLAIENGYGSVRTRGRFGDARLTAKYGSVTADEVGDLVLVAPYGTAEIDTVTGTLDATVGHGHLQIARVDGAATLRGAHGTIDIGTAAGRVDATTSGPVTIGRALTDVTARSAHGALRVRAAEGGTVRLENAYAEVEVGVPAGVAAWVDATATHGTVRNELTPDPAAAASDRTVELRLRNNWADILIRRA